MAGQRKVKTPKATKTLSFQNIGHFDRMRTSKRNGKIKTYLKFFYPFNRKFSN
jgi:hypothetical protein